MYEQQIEQLGNFQLRIHDQVCVKSKDDSVYVLSLFFCILRYLFCVTDDNAGRCYSYHRNSCSIKNWSSCHEGCAKSNVRSAINVLIIL